MLAFLILYFLNLSIELPKNVTYVMSNCYRFKDFLLKNVNVNKRPVSKLAQHQMEIYVMFLTILRILSCTYGKETCQIKIQMNDQWNSQG